MSDLCLLWLHLEARHRFRTLILAPDKGLSAGVWMHTEISTDQSAVRPGDSRHWTVSSQAQRLYMWLLKIEVPWPSILWESKTQKPRFPSAELPYCPTVLLSLLPFRLVGSAAVARSFGIVARFNGLASDFRDTTIKANLKHCSAQRAQGRHV